mmetsp:Transcript_27793/g.33990  ORF Transcript_27793/g.33990 Transcript_27793/m.33990 type:complete len:296 (+) Transcript_27793:55-942(+)
MESTHIKVVLVGFGSVSQHFCKIILLKQRPKKLFERIRVVGVCDSSGAIYDENGFSLQQLLNHKEKTGLVEFASTQNQEQIRSFKDAEEMVKSIPSYDVLVDASPVNLNDGNPGLQCARISIARGANVVFANKAPLVLDYKGLHDLAIEQKVEIAFSATVCGGLPVINVGQRDLVGADFVSIKGIFNSTTNYILSQMELGNSREHALAEAQKTGIAEADPHLDVAGIDTANKLVIIANSLLKIDTPIRLEQVVICGIEKISKQDLDSAKAEGYTIKLVASATMDKNMKKYSYTVR